MIDLINSRRGYLFMICAHLVLGVAVKFAGIVVGGAYLGLFALFTYDVFITRDRNSRAGFYALYIMGMEMVYRMVGAPFSWELGKYASIIILLVGIMVGRRKYTSWTFVFLLLLLLPSMFFSVGHSAERLRKMIMFNISGPVSLACSGLY